MLTRYMYVQFFIWKKSNCIFSHNNINKFNHFYRSKISVYYDTCQFLDVPKANISTEPRSFYGSYISILSQVVSCPAPDGIQWQKSIDGLKFQNIDISKAKYHGRSLNSMSPSLEMKQISFDDKLFYRLHVWNKIGERVSNTVFLGCMYINHFFFYKTIYHSNCNEYVLYACI